MKFKNFFKKNKKIENQEQSDDVVYKNYAENYGSDLGDRIGFCSYLNTNCSVYHPETTVGKYTSIGSNVLIGAGQHPLKWLTTSPLVWNIIGDNNKIQLHPAFKNIDINRYLWEPYKPVKIGNDVWIGQNVVIMDGVEIGDGAIIASNAVVTHSIPAFELWGGVPARFIKRRFDDVTIEKLKKLKWWDLPFDKIKDLPFENVDECIKILELRCK